MSDAVGSKPSPDPYASARDENAALRTLSEKAVMRMSQMKKALMEKTVALLAEQQLRRSAESRLGAEMRRAIKLSAHNQHIAGASTKLQQQHSKLQQMLKDARAEAERYSTENACLRTAYKDFAESLQAELHLYEMDAQALSTGMRERMNKLLDSSSEMFLAPFSAAQDPTQGTGLSRPSSSTACAGPLTPERSVSDASTASSAVLNDKGPCSSLSTALAPTRSYLAVSLRTMLTPTSQAVVKSAHAEPLQLQSREEGSERRQDWPALPAPSPAEAGAPDDDCAGMTRMPALQEASAAGCSAQQLVLRKPPHRHTSSGFSMELLPPTSFPAANKEQDMWRESPSPSHSQSSGDMASHGAMPVIDTGRGQLVSGGSKGKCLNRQGGSLSSSHDERFHSPRTTAAEEQEDSFAEDFPSFSRQIVHRRSPPRSFLLSMPDGR